MTAIDGGVGEEVKKRGRVAWREREGCRVLDEFEQVL